ncbi:hypothetical protein K469DRAFT_664124 [Zopfia rhizophila CBS 207.26]|uniref:Uncharacterized protein n=1 Tax=Zopfia rhizophila CBS 207.26 TaxID=1314779 RepID=A0A6A6E660_9PEZI|nr:hypothetical protein K469DRAFT_664124 [Zopfia rhizophila CBS 207.26]
MLSCFRITSIRPRAKRKSRRPKSSTIEIHTHSSHSTAGTWRLAELSYDTASDTNFISQKLVKNVLDKRIRTLEKEPREWITRQNECQQLVEGYVDLVWCFERSPRRVHGPTRFVVSAVYDPPYDAVLGRRDSIKHGIMTEKDCG